MKPSPPPARYNDAVAGRSIGRYQVVRLLGTGGFSSVYLARDDRLDADVAIKVLAENWAADDEISRRFVEEARLLRRCNDDRVVRVHTIEQLDDGRPYFVMDYADAGTLADRMLAALDDARRFEVAEALAVARELADCLTVVHANGIVHRDLKPSNILFRTTRTAERMVLGDFGLARQLLGATRRTILAGTPEYIAPEQADPALAATVDERADVYAAAVILHELLTGAVPFTHADFESAAAAREQAPDLRAARPDVPAAVAAVVARGMALDREQRFPSGLAWLAALDEVTPLATGAPPAGALPAAALPAAALPAAALPAGALPAGALPAVVPFATGPLASAAAPAPTAAVPTAGAPTGGAPTWSAPTAPVPTAGAAAPALPATPVPPSVSAPPPPPSLPGRPAPAAPAPPPPPRAARKPLWPLFAGVVGALALIVALAVLIGRNHSSTPGAPAASAPPAAAPSTAAPPTTLAAAPSTTPTTAAQAPGAPAGPASWFAAASGPTCRAATNAEKLPGVVSAVTCSAPGVTAVFGQTGSALEASAFLERLDRRRAGASETAWGSGLAVSYGAATNPSIAWGYTGEPFVGVATGTAGTTRSALLSWWATTGRAVRAGG